jgi:hypothetical protein
VIETSVPGPRFSSRSASTTSPSIRLEFVHVVSVSVVDATTVGTAFR